MAVQTGNGSEITLSGGNGGNFNTAILVLTMDMGEESVETLPFVPLKNPSTGTLSGENREFHEVGDFPTARQITAEGLWDITDIPTNGPSIEARTKYNATVSLPTAGVTYRNEVFITTQTGPNLVNNELMMLTVVFQCTNQLEDANRGWTAAT